MASEYTANYELPIWAADDAFLREEFNEANQKIDGALAGKAGKTELAAAKTNLEAQIGAVDAALAAKADTADLAAKCEIVTGTYTGNGAASRTIALGFKPKAVYVCREDGTTADTNQSAVKLCYGGLALDGLPLQNEGNTILSVAGNGFTVALKNESNLSVRIVSNYSGYVFHYIAFR